MPSQPGRVFTGTDSPGGPLGGDIWFRDSGDIYQFIPPATWSVLAPRRLGIRHPATASSVDDWAFIADRAYEVKSIKEIHSVAGSDGSAVTADVRKITDASAPGAAAGATVLEMLSTALDLKSTANTRVTGTLVTTVADLRLAVNDKIGINFAGTLTALAGCVIVIELQAI